MLKLKGDILGTEHLYVHVFGTPDWDVTLGAGSGPLQYRPDHYVPIRVPIFDEAATQNARNSNVYNQQDNQPYQDKVAAIYRWPYRPEMQFSVFELAVNGFELTHNDNQTELINISGDAQTELVGRLLADDVVFVDLLYDLLNADNDPLRPFGSDRELIFALGAEEELVNIDLNSRVNFIDMAHLKQLAAEDLLSIRLYQNSDAENILWEMSVRGLYVVSSDDLDSRKYKSFLVKDETRFTGSLVNAAILPQPPKIEVTLLTKINEGDEIEWIIEALRGGHSGVNEIDDLPSSVSNGENKPYAYGNIKDNNLIARTGLPSENDGRYNYPWYSKRYKHNESGKTIKFNPNPPVHLPNRYCRKLNEAGCTRVGGSKMIDVNTANPRYGYKVTARIFRSTGDIEEENTTVRLDDKDMIRQEYADLIATVKNMAPYTDYGVMFQQLAHIPMRDDLVDKNSFGDVLRGAWSQAQYQYMLTGNMLEMTDGLKGNVLNKRSKYQSTLCFG